MSRALSEWICAMQVHQADGMLATPLTAQKLNQIQFDACADAERINYPLGNGSAPFTKPRFYVWHTNTMYTEESWVDELVFVWGDTMAFSAWLKVRAT